jgi:molybdenum cofactor biosynthesis enzyme MoaA
MPQHRSQVPDLLFEDVCAARVAEIEPLLDAPEQVTAADPLHRLTVFLTYRCNLDCPYCKTIARTPQELTRFPQKRETFTCAQFETLLASLGTTPVRHLHFTGGEAALVRDLPQMVRLAKQRGVACVSITSNGAVSPDIYQALIAAGMDEIRISLDAHEPELGAALTQRQRAWHATVESARAIAAARDAGAPVFLILNAVIGRHNQEVVADLVRFLINLRPNDIKLITEVQEKGWLGQFPGATEQVAQIRAMLADELPEAFPLLRRKLNTVFHAESIGLEDTSAPEGRPWRCYIPLTERTVDARFYYPCSVYLREGGPPLGRIDEPQDLQRQRTAAFVRDHDCRSDPICGRYCLHCTRVYNQAANEALW